MAAAATPRTTVYLHIGPPKTGTTFIQGVLRHWHAELRDAGVLFPAVPTHDHFNAALDVRGDHGFGFGPGRELRRPRAKGAWPRLVGATLAHEGTVVISHELFATADSRHARQALADLADTDLHVVLTVRDPARQLVSSWQERIKHGNTQPFHRVARKLAKRRGWGSRAQDVPRVLDSWTHGIAADHVHVVTVPPSGSDPMVLWRRFAELIGVDPDAFDPSKAPRSNESLGVAEIELLRRINLQLDGRIQHPAYSRIVTALYANDILAGVSASPPPRLPKGLVRATEEIADDWIDVIRARGYDVRGDLEELRPRHRDGQVPRAARDKDINAAAVRATAELLLAVTDLYEPRHALRTAFGTTAGRLGYATLSAGQRARFRLGRRGRVGRGR